MSDKKSLFMPIIVLVSICLVISSALALTNSVTEPIIVAAEQAAAEAARAEVLPGGTGFTKMDVTGLPASVTEVYAPADNSGYVMMLTTKGFGGKISMILGMDTEGVITGVKVLKHAETQGIGTKVMDAPEFAHQFLGKGEALDGINTISGATISSKAFINGVKPAFEAYKVLKEAA